MSWTKESLSTVPQRNGFRMRGEAMTRLEVFSDAAFAFALTTLVVSVGSIPGDLGELIEALKRVPAFALSFAQIALFWLAHRGWSRRYGLEDGWTTGLTLGMIFTILVYVFPLRLMFSTFLSWASGGWMPADFAATSAWDVQSLLAIYGIGFCVLTGILALLFYRALRSSEELMLDGEEILQTKSGIAAWLSQSIIGLVSTLWALFLPTQLGVMAGFAYFLIPITMMVSGRYFGSRIKAVRSNKEAADES
ncbi:TMEM175 family protein [Pelagicoccus sp. SDUM812002]|uniref:TMEM175 family protein n=1 Tax=Pelagicoccus sp. SDUM812002 TaxID=3041266 RepID=UPI00280F7CB0|nr:TMEM175 family protein [Pelagicoccus sp. SDUM812002]MDQ8184385.1 TMEM175 family protein [Pelagicoccus sp. SDUM812002]